MEVIEQGWQLHVHVGIPTSIMKSETTAVVDWSIIKFLPNLVLARLNVKAFFVDTLKNQLGFFWNRVNFFFQTFYIWLYRSKLDLSTWKLEISKDIE